MRAGQSIGGIIKKAFAQLTAPGLTAAQNVERCSLSTFQVKVAAIDTNVVVRVVGSLDGTDFFQVTLDSSDVPNLTIVASVVTITANGTYEIRVKKGKYKKLKLDFVSESGGTAATIDSRLIAGN